MQQPYQRNPASATPLHSAVQGALFTTTIVSSSRLAQGETICSSSLCNLGVEHQPSIFLPPSSPLLPNHHQHLNSPTLHIHDQDSSSWAGLLQGTRQVSLQDSSVKGISLQATQTGRPASASDSGARRSHPLSIKVLKTRRSLFP